MDRPRVDIIIPVYNQPGLTGGCLKSIRERSDVPYNIILIDNASDDATGRLIDNIKTEFGNVTLIRNIDNVGWVKAVNQGIKLSTAPYICIMNNDTIVHTDKWLSGLIRVLEMKKEIGLVNPMFEIKKKVGKKPYIEIDFCRGYCVLIKREVIDKIGGLDEAYGLGYYDDDDFSVRAIRAGYRCVRANDIYVEHLRDSTFKELFRDDKRRELHEKNKALFYSRYGRRLKVLAIMSRDADNDASLRDTLFSVARDQHVVYLWHSGKPFQMAHINIREKHFPKFFGSLLFRMAVSLNSRKRHEKHYDIVFVDDDRLCRELSRMRTNVYHASAANDGDKIERLIKEAQRS